jgi:hypothetical protein
MDAYSYKLHLASEHVEFVKDVTNVIISYTPVSGIIDTVRFGQKWLRKKRMAHRVARYMAESDRRNFIKSRGRRITGLYKKWGRRHSAARIYPTAY